MGEDYKTDIFRTIELFSSLSDEEINQGRKRVVTKKFWKNEAILHGEDTNEILPDEYGEEGDGGLMLRIKLTHQNIADMTGLARETVTRMLDKWQQDGGITILQHKFIRLGLSFQKEDLDYSFNASNDKRRVLWQ
jgi:hypothetical protein